MGKRPESRETLRLFQNNKDKNAEKRVKKFMLEEATPRISELRASDESGDKDEEEKEGYQNLSFIAKSSVDDEDEDSMNISVRSSPVLPQDGLRMMRAKTGENPKRNSKDDSININEGQNNSDDDSKYYAKNNLNDILSQRDDEEMSFTRRERRSTIENIKEPTNFLYNETFEQQSEKLRKASIFGSLKTWKIMKMIVKSGDDLRQEQFAMQIIDLMAQLFQVNGVGCWLKPYEILATDNGCGIMVCLKDAMSIDQIKKKLPSGMSTLKDYFLYNFGGQRSSLYKDARHNFARSLAGYSLL